MILTSNLADYTSGLIKSSVNAFERQLLRLSHCDLCRSDVSSFHLLCDYCYQDLPQFNYQHFNGNLLNWPSVNQTLSHQHFDYLFALSPYIWPFDYWLKQLKFYRRFEYAKLLAQLLASRWCYDHLEQYQQIDYLDALFTPVAIHAKKWAKRGYNQSHLIARLFCRFNSLAHNGRVIKRVLQHTSQVGQTGAARRKQLRGAFTLSQAELALPETVFIVDDVVTTGSTVNEIARLLKQQGVKKVGVIAIALALPHNAFD